MKTTRMQLNTVKKFQWYYCSVYIQCNLTIYTFNTNILFVNTITKGCSMCYVILSSWSWFSSASKMETSKCVSSHDTATQSGQWDNRNDPRTLPVGDIWTIDFVSFEQTNMRPDWVAHTPLGDIILLSVTIRFTFSFTFQR